MQQQLFIGISDALTPVQTLMVIYPHAKHKTKEK